ncbi:MAG: type 1 glutamine amidotransferase domain-containing protein [Selenomonadaceae bacterium]|nr:type 1 glutamine amidotransferase domain-containing protein [Selenomonadaceae bacterium]
MKKILCVVTSNNVKGATGIPTGFWLSELTHPLEKFSAAGFDFELASIKGCKPPIDKDSLDFTDPINKKFWDDENFQSKLANTIKLDDANAADFDAIFFAGGHGVMWDFADSTAIQKITREIYERGGIVSAVCHGPAALVNVKLSDGKFLVDGKNLTAFTNGEEADVQATDIVPFLLETALKNHGANHIAAANWSNHVVEDGRLVTGQNPASAGGVGEAVVKLLS